MKQSDGDKMFLVTFGIYLSLYSIVSTAYCLMNAYTIAKNAWIAIDIFDKSLPKRQ